MSIRLSWFVAGVLCASLPVAGQAVDPARPNVLLVIADDVGVGRIGAYDAHPSPARTPTLDLMAEHGLLFRNAWSHPVCSPARTAMLTGRYGYRTGIGTSIPYDVSGPIIGSGGPFLLLDHEVPVSRLLARNGYRTAAIGKWHMGNSEGGGYDHPIQMGFEQHRGAIAVGGYYNWPKNEADSSGNVQFDEPGYVTSVNVDDALEVIDEFGGDPWFVWLALTAAHEPYPEPPLELLSAETAAAVSAPDVSKETLHKATVEALDTELGRLLGSLRPAVLANTLVVFIGDNGSPSDSLPDPAVEPFKGAKGSLQEGGIHVPLLAAGVGIAQPGREVEHLVGNVDLFATIVELTGSRDSPNPLDAVSLAPLMADPDAPPARRVVFSERIVPNGFGPYDKLKRTVRDERYKVVHTILPLVEQPLRLYDLQLDPLEATNLLAEGQPPLDDEQQEAFDRLSAMLLSLPDG